MTDYYPLLSRAVAGLEKNTGEARRALYERARTALVEQLRGANPPLSEPEITRERLALEEAVRKVEAEAARQMRFVRPEPPRLDTARAEPRAEPAAPRPPPPREKSREEAPVRAPVRPAPPERPAPQRPAPPPAPPERPSISSNGIRGFRDVVAEAESLGGATAEASRSAREAYAAVPADVPELDRLEPRLEPEGLRPGPASTRPRAPQPLEEEPPPLEEEAPRAEPPPRRRAAGPAPRRPSYEQDEQQRASRKGLIAAVLTVLIIAGLGAAAYWQRERISAVFGVVRNVATQTPRDTSQSRPKVEDRIGQPGQQAGRQPQQGGRPGTQTPVVAQRVVLYEEDPQNPEGNRYVGSSLWRTETVSPGPGLSPELAVRADVEVPERRLAMTMSIRRNTDQALPASHTIEIMFNLPADFTFGGVANVPGLLMKESEQTRGAPLSGLAVKVTNNFFLVGLSATEGDVQRNIQLLKDRAWFDIPIVYNNGRRAILAVEKGTPGERAFGDAFAAWGR